MSETVLVALITFAAGLVGAAVGAFATYKAASFGEQANREKILHDEKRAAYSAMFNAFERLQQCFAPWPDGEMSREGKADVKNCLNSFVYAVLWARIFAPDSVKKPLTNWVTAVNDLVIEFKAPNNSVLHSAVIRAVREDLLSFNRRAKRE